MFQRFIVRCAERPLRSTALALGGCYYLNSTREFYHETLLIDTSEFLKDSSTSSTHTPQLFLFLAKALPLKTLSAIWGKITSITLPKGVVRESILASFSTFFGIDMSQAEKNISDYSSLQDLFRRRLKEDAKKIDKWAKIISPAEGTILNCGCIESNQFDANAAMTRIDQIKGISYSANAFIGEKALSPSSPKNALFYTTIYLAPGDYHRFHSPSEITFSKLRHFDGELLSVNPIIAELIHGLFILNERIALIGRWKYGFMSVVPVGATNVGSIHLSFLDRFDIVTNKSWILRNIGSFKEKSIEGKEFEKGSELGYFEMGSTIVMIFEAPKDFKFTIEPYQKVKMGQSISNY